jgi:hypothetical protein
MATSTLAPSTAPPAAPAAGVGERPGGRRFLRPPSSATLLGLVLALIVWLLELRPLIDNSFLIHLQTGHWILDHRSIPTGDVFSFSAAGAPWVVQSWLASVIYAAIDQAVGPFGIQVLRAATCALITFLVFQLALRLVGDRTRATLLAFAATGMSITVWAERPLLQGVLAMVVLIWVVELPGSFVGRHPLAVVPPLMWVWANFHGSFSLGFAYLVLHLAGRWLDGARPTQGRERTLLCATGIALGACLVTPLGVKLLTFPVELLSRGDTLAHIREWRSPDFHSVMGMLFALWIVVFVVGVARGGERCSRRDLLVSVVFLLLALWALRNLVVAPLVALPVVARACAVTERRPDRRPFFNVVVLALFLVLGITGFAQAAGGKHFDFSGYPVKALEAVENEGLVGKRLLTTDAWAAYVIHEYGPRQPVFLDDRYDMYPTALSDDYFDLADGKANWQQILDRHDIEVIVWDEDEPLAALLDLDTARWIRIHRHADEPKPAATQGEAASSEAETRPSAWVRRPPS